MGNRVLITGSTGMVGKGVLLECLDSDNIESVLVINRETVGIEHRKLKEIIHRDFFDLSLLEMELNGYDACFFCLGVSSAGMKEDKYSNITYELTKHFSDTFIKQNPDSIFIYVSGTGTDSSEKGRVMWARIKGKTENMILNKGFKDAYAFRPGIILPTKGVRSKTNWYNLFYTLFKPLNPLLLRSKYVTTTEKVGLAMINILQNQRNSKHLENKDINLMARK